MGMLKKFTILGVGTMGPTLAHLHCVISPALLWEKPRFTPRPARISFFGNHIPAPQAALLQGLTPNYCKPQQYVQER
jgi:hypothetical protein